MASRVVADNPSALYPRSRQRASSAVPRSWTTLWGQPSERVPELEWRRLKGLARDLAEATELVDHRDKFGNLVGAADLAGEPVHRWFSYKEGYSPALLGALLDALDVKDNLKILDPFGGVATTALAGITDPRVAEVRSIEYSPLAHFIGSAKLEWSRLDPTRLKSFLAAALDYPRIGHVEIPTLSTFSNREVFEPQRLRSLLRARDHIHSMVTLEPEERAFFLLGLAAIVEDVSGAMKDGRALRIVRHRRRRDTSLGLHPPAVPVRGAVKRRLAGQWTAMIEDLETLAGQAAQAQRKRAMHLRGDARALQDVRFAERQMAVPAGWADIACFSPPYLNCIDYTEVHKLELWLLGLVKSQEEFKRTREGTLRSHPSISFAERSYFEGLKGPAIDYINGASAWISRYGARREVGPIVRQYFEDMFQVWREVHRGLHSEGLAACVVANSNFSRRLVTKEGGVEEVWRLPILTDVVLAHLAIAAGFEEVQLWDARELRPRNVRSGRSRESIVIASKTSLLDRVRGESSHGR